MRGMLKRAMAAVCAMVLCLGCTGAMAEFSPLYDALRQKEGLTLLVSGSVETLNKLSSDSLAYVNDWLGRTQVRLSANGDSQAQVSMDGESVFAVSVAHQNGYALTTFYPSAGAYLTDENSQDALEILTGMPSGFPDVFQLPGLYADLSFGLYDRLASVVTPKLSKDKTSIKNASASTSYENYTLTGDQMNEAWPQVLEVLLPALEKALSDQKGWYREAEALLRGLEFSGECRFKRFFDKENGDMGMQFTGQAAKGEDKRKVTIFGGFTPDKGGYISVNLPAVKGKNTLKVQLGVKLTEKNGVRTLTLEGSYSRNMDGDAASAELDGSIKNTVGETGESWSGKINISTTVNKTKATWTLTPDLEWTDEGMIGLVGVQKKEGKTVALKATLRLEMKDMEPLNVPHGGSAKDLRAVDTQRAREAVMEELLPLSQNLIQLLLTLPESDRNLLMHELRTDEWMNGPVVPVTQDAAPGSNYTVEEDEKG